MAPRLRTIANMDEMWIALLLLGGCGVRNGEEFASQGDRELFTTKDGRAK